MKYPDTGAFIVIDSKNNIIGPLTGKYYSSILHKIKDGPLTDVKITKIDTKKNYKIENQHNAILDVNIKDIVGTNADDLSFQVINKEEKNRKTVSNTNNIGLVINVIMFIFVMFVIIMAYRFYASH